MQAEYTQNIPRRYRPSGDGRFLYRFRGRDYVLTREQTLRHIKLHWNWVYVILALAAGTLLAFLLVVDLGFPWRTLPMAGFIILSLVWMLGFHWRTAALFEACDTREVAKAEGMAARGVQWLEYNRSTTYLPNNPPPLKLFVYCVGNFGGFVCFMYLLWPSPANLEVLEIVMFAAICVVAAALWLKYFAVSLYAFCRAIAGNRASTSGPEAPPSN